MKTLIISDLENVQESKKIDSIIRKVVGILLTAINDWPSPVIDLENYELEVKIFIGSKTTKQKIKSALTQIDFSKNSWQAESLTQVIDVFEFYKDGMSLKEIITELKIKLEQEKLI